MSCHCDLLPHEQLLRLILPFLLLALAPHALAQPAANNFPPLPELLQYQASKSKQGTRWAPFRKYAMRRMRLPEPNDASNNHLWGYHVSLPDSSFQASAEGRRSSRLRRDRPPRRFPPTGLLGQAHLPPLCRVDRSYRLHLVLPATILQHPLLPQRGSQYPHRHHDLGRLLPDGDQRIRTLISNALASGLEGLFLDTQESEYALFLLPKEEDF